MHFSTLLSIAVSAVAIVAAKRVQPPHIFTCDDDTRKRAYCCQDVNSDECGIALTDNSYEGPTRYGCFAKEEYPVCCKDFELDDFFGVAGIDCKAGTDVPDDGTDSKK